ncbi:hypothetical protein D9M72_394490 [compost metagenome]
MDEDVLDRVRRLVPIDRRIDDRVVHEERRFLGAFMPGERVVLERAIPIGIGAERVHQRRLVVGGAAHPAIGHACPFGDRALLGGKIGGGAGDAEIFVGVAAGPRVGRRRQDVPLCRIMQRVIEPGERPGGIAHRRMAGHVLDAFAVDIDLAAVAQAFQIFGAGEGPRPVGAEILCSHFLLLEFRQG